MKISEIITDELLERYQRHRVAIRAAQRPIVRPLVARVLAKPVTAPARRLQQPIKRPVTQPTKPVRKPQQTTGLNPKIDVAYGPNFKRDNINPIPPMTDMDRKIYGIEKRG